MNLYMPEYFLMDLAATAAFGILAIVLVVFGYKVFDKLTPKLPFDESLKSGNIAAAIVIGSFILGLCYVVAHVVSAIAASGS
jgi:putative membrane protein